MRIAFFVDAFPALSETFVLEQIVGMIDAGHDVHIYARNQDSSGICHPIVGKYDLLAKTTYLPRLSPAWHRRIPIAISTLYRSISSGKFRNVLSTLSLTRFGRRAIKLYLAARSASFLHAPDYDILHCQFGHLGAWLAPLKMAGILSGKLVTSFRGADTTRFVNDDLKKYDELFSNGDAFMPVSQSLRKRLLDLGCPESRIRVLHSGIDTRRFAYEERRRMDAPLKLLSVGRLTEKKGFHYAIDAVRFLHDRGLDVRFTIVGDGEDRIRLEQRARDMPFDDIVKFKGSLDTDGVQAELQSADIFISPSITASCGDMEGIPNALKEAMAVGLPVVATRHGGIPELVTDGQTGLLVDEKDAQQLADAVIRLVEDPDRTSRMTNSARQFVEHHFDIMGLNRALEASYRELLCGP